VPGVLAHRARAEGLLYHAAPLGFVDAIDAIKPRVLIGATGAPGTFTQQVVEGMCVHNDRPVLLALSNPTSRAGCRVGST